MKIRKIETLSNMPLEKVFGTNEWYYSAEWTGDIYEAEEMIQSGHVFEGTTMYLVRYPDGKVLMPLEKKKNVYIQRPIWDNDGIAILTVDFDDKEISVYHFNESSFFLKCITKLPLSSVADCYNMQLTMSPLSLYRHGADGMFELVWPEKVSFMLEDSESLIHRDCDELYFTRWYEDSEYKEEIYVRSVHTGEIIRHFPGILYDMPDGIWWLL